MDKNLLNLKSDLKDKKQMVLFLGAGVNYSPNKALLWNDIISRFIQEALPLLEMPIEDVTYLQRALDPMNTADIQLQLQGNSEFLPETKVAVVKQLLGNTYIPLLQNIIYSQCNSEVLKDACEKYVKSNSNIKDTPFYTLFSVAELIIRNNNIKAVVTYNYDNFLCEAIKLLQKHKDYFDAGIERVNEKEFYPIDAYSGWMDNPFNETSFLIYHIHGYIQPLDAFIPNERNKIVMSLDEFYDSAKDVYSWQTATQIHFLSHYACLFIGASLSDMTMQRVLNYANLQYNRENVYYLTFEGNAIQTLKNMFHEENHLCVIATDSFENIYKELLNKKI